MVARAASVLATVLTVPIAFDYLGPERFGLLATITSFTGLLVFADFGLGSGLINAVATADGRDDRAAMIRAISTATAVLASVAAIGGIAFAILFTAVDWPALLGITHPTAGHDTGVAVGVFAVLFLVNLPLGVAQRVQLGTQAGFWANVWLALGSLLGLAGLALAVTAGLGLPWLVAALVGAPVIAAAGNTLDLFIRRMPWARPRFRAIDAATVTGLARLGAGFFALQIAMAVAFQGDVLVAANVVGAEAAGEYVIVLRLFMLAPMLINMVLLNLWPAYAESAARGDPDWAYGTMRRTTVATLVATIATSLAIGLAHRPILDLWIGPTFRPDTGLLVGMGVWAVLSTTMSTISVFFNGLGILRFQVITAGVMAIVSIVASIVLAGRIGVAGVIWGTVLAYVCCSAIPTVLYLPRVLANLRQRAAAAS